MRDAKQILTRHPDEKDREIDLGQIELGLHDVEAPGIPVVVVSEKSTDTTTSRNEVAGVLR